MRIPFGLLPLILLITYSCSNSRDSSKSNNPVVDIEQVKDSLAQWDEIPSDSIHVVKLKEPGLYLTQGFGRVENMIRLVKIYPDRFHVLDSIMAFQEVDIYRQKKVSYDYKNNWFAYSSVSSGTSDLTNQLSLVRVENNHFSELFTYSKSAGFMDPEDPIYLYSESAKINELESNSEKLVLETIFESETENTSVPSHIKMVDTVTFEFSKTKNKFVLKEFRDYFVKNEFRINDGEYVFKSEY